MKRTLLLLFLLPLLNNCGQYSAIVGPSITFAETGSILQTTSSLSSSLVMNNVKQDIKDEVNGVNICPTIHSSELNQIFFETLDHMDCFFDPMSIYR